MRATLYQDVAGTRWLFHHHNDPHDDEYENDDDDLDDHCEPFFTEMSTQTR